MSRLAGLWTCFALTALLALPVGCGDSDGTFVLLNLNGSVTGIRSISVEFTFEGGKSDTTVFQATGNTDITLPTTASLKLRSGEGKFTVVATALDGYQRSLAAGTKAGDVKRNQTAVVDIELSPTDPRGGSGIDGGAALDAAAGLDGGPGIDVGTSIDGERRMDVGAASVETNPDVETEDVPLYDAGSEDVPTVDAPVVPTGGTTGAGGAIGSGADGMVSANGGSTGTGGMGGTAGTSGVAGTGGTGTGTSLGTGGSTDIGGSTGTGAIAGTGGITGTGGGTGGTPTYLLTVTPSTRDFGVVQPGSTSPAVSFTIVNEGDATTPPLVVSSDNPSIFQVSPSDCTGKTLAPAGSCTATFTFTPAAPGAVQAAGSVGPTGGTAATFTLTGAGTSAKAELAFVPTSLDFKAVDVSTTSAAKTLTLKNIGSVSSDVITVAPSGSGAFSIASDGCSSTTLAQGAQCLVTITFTPAAVGAATATVGAQTPSGITASATLTGSGRDYVDLSVTFTGTGDGSVTVKGASNTTIATCTNSASPCAVKVPRTAERADVTLTETPSQYSYFSKWTGACTGTTTSCALSIDSTTEVSVQFTRRMYTVTVNKDTTRGTGTIVSSPGGIDCGSTCSGSFPQGSSVTLTATADAGFGLESWSGAGCSGAGACTFAVAAATTVTATFGPAKYLLTVNTSGAGTVTSLGNEITCPGTCSATLPIGTNVYLSAAGFGNYVFAGWSDSRTVNPCSGTGTCSVTMNGPTTVTAMFAVPLTCDFSENQVCSGTTTDTFGPIGPTACRAQCGLILPARGYTRGCWGIVSTNCVCRTGTATATTASSNAGNCL